MTIEKLDSPQAIFEYKNSWKGCNPVQVDVDSFQWSKIFCKNNFENHSWAIKKHTRPDDSHTLTFAKAEDKAKFIDAYQLHNPNFDSTYCDS